ncbi:MAG: ATP-binding cassette domain-containing protein [Candidatus Marinimicrobia bacterium]|nr:ATP-binding cassette domain-containing protein [Candidatus Neomarinimicrobiota bacterium]MCF7839946.1 ATP-binding cassette domain-containing protein [Candidatus Neomarinimicrobiota bacterium]
MFSLNGVSKRFGSFTALHPLDVAFREGETSVLIGPSGCGKSTLLKLMIGLLKPDSGTIHFNNQPISPTNIQILRHQMGYVIQEGGLFPHLSVEQNITVMARHLDWSISDIRQRLADLSALTQFPENLWSRYPLQLSGGQRQRVSLMRALMLDPKVLLLDEPLGALDPMIRADLQQDLKEIFNQLEKTVVLVTHDMGEASFFGNEIILMRQGKIVQKGTIKTLVNQPTDPFVKDFIQAQRQVTVIEGNNP